MSRASNRVLSSLNTLERLLSRNEGRRLPLWFAVLGALLTLPALFVGFAIDDYVFLSNFMGTPGLESLQEPVWNTFSFAGGDPEKTRYRMERGLLPWWTAESWRIDFWRPLTSISHWIDYKLFGLRAWPMHVNSILLYGALVALTTVLYRRIVGLNWVAALAGLLFAVDAAHAVPAGWLSNRNATLSALFAVVALLAHHRWRQTAWKPGLPVALVCVTLSLLSAEAGVAIGGYLFAYAMFLDPLVKPGGNGSSRTLSAYMKSFVLLFPYLVVVVVWRGVYGALGHGVHGSMLYIDPVNEPLAYLRGTLLHFPIGVMALLGFPDSTAWAYSPPAVQMVHAAAAMVFVVAGTWLIWPLLRRDPRARFLAAGMALAMFPGCATAPMDRNLMFPSIGGMALIAVYIAGFKDGVDWTAARPPSLNRNVAAVLLVLHLAMSPPLFLFGSYSIKILDGVFMRANHSVPVSGKDGERIVVVNTAWDLLGASLPILSSGEGRQVPLHWAWLSAGMLPVEITRLDHRTLELRPEGGFLRQPWAQIFRRPSTHPMAPGDRVELEWMTAEVVEVNEEGRPLAARFQFGTPLEDSTITWLTWSGTKYVPYAPPDLGESNIVPGASALHMLLPKIVPAPKFVDTVTSK